GPGRVTLSAANTYNGVTNVVQGALRIQDPNALGTTANGTFVSAGAALEIDGNPLGNGAFLAVASEPLVITGEGLANGPILDNTGALRNVSGNNFWTGTVALLN